MAAKAATARLPPVLRSENRAEARRAPPACGGTVLVSGSLPLSTSACGSRQSNAGPDLMTARESSPAPLNQDVYESAGFCRTCYAKANLDMVVAGWGVGGVGWRGDLVALGGRERERGGGGATTAEAMDRPGTSCSATCCCCCCAKPPAPGHHLVMSSTLQDEKHHDTETLMVST